MKAIDGSHEVLPPCSVSPPRSDRESSPEPCSLPSEPMLHHLKLNGHGLLHDPVDITAAPEAPLPPSSSPITVNGHPVVVNGRGHHDTADSGIADSLDSLTLDEEGEGSVSSLREQLTSVRHELRLRDEEVARLSRIRTDVESELEELTASLFQEAHNMVRTANVAQAQAERRLRESEMQVEVLQAEVSALKTLVITSTPSRPNPHLHPQLQPDSAAGEGRNLFARKHRRSPSHFNLKYGRENSPPDSPVREARAGSPALVQRELSAPTAAEDLEVDPVSHKEFVLWRAAPRVDRNDPFLARVYREDIGPCLEFANTELGARVAEAVEAGAIFIESVTDKTRTAFPKRCALMEVPRLCHYRLRLPDQDLWHPISHLCRNRITAVCDFLNYLRYIERGLVKSSEPEVYWEVMRLRKEMALARLGLPLSS